MRLLGYPGWLLGPLLGYTVWLLRCCYAVARVLWVVARVPRTIARAVARVHSVVLRCFYAVARVLGVVARAVARYPGWLLGCC